MIYLDYSATTKPRKEVLDTFVKVSSDFIGNPNSLHKLGVDANAIIESSTNQIKTLLHTEEDIIYTSGSSESNNLAIIGLALKYQNRGKHIITTRLEHSSIYGPLSFLMKQGFRVDFVETDENGMINLEQIKERITEETILVSISAVNSEIGLRQRVEEIGLFLKDYPKCFFHVDATQCIGKDNLSLENIDLMSFSAHKFYGIKGIGALVKKRKIELEPLIHGGKSTTKYRSGTPAPALIASFAKALRLALENVKENYQYVEQLNKELQEFVSTYPKVVINHNAYCLPHMLNLSILGVKPETSQHALEEFDIYVSTQSACASGNSSSPSVLAFTNDPDRASSSIRISLSPFTTKEEIEAFKKAFTICYKNLA
ncbi:MAG: cysteine desulfurase family protein [Bacilli bacterium]|nr:cysteine desulfurase family protein [Bacilli bacterium]